MMLCNKIDKEKLPQFVTLAGDEWLAEEKLDGDRMQLVWKDSKLALITRGKSGDVIERYPELQDFKRSQDCVLDGEMCVLDENGLSQFNEGIAFRTHLKDPEKIKSAVINYPVTYVIFDVLEASGQDLRELPLTERRKILDSMNLDHPHIKVVGQSDDILGLWKKVTDNGGEGIILKKKNSIYRDNFRSSCWKKVKDLKECDVVFTNYTTNPKGIRIDNTDDIAVQCSGYHADPVKRVIDNDGKALITIRHLGKTKTGKYRQPVYLKMVVN